MYSHIATGDSGWRLKSLQWQLIRQLVECCLIEGWIDKQRITVTTTRDYLNLNPSLTGFLSNLPLEYQCKFSSSTPLISIHIEHDTDVLLIVQPAFCTPWRLLPHCFPIKYSHDNIKCRNIVQSDCINELVEEQAVLTSLLSVMSIDNLSKVGIKTLRNNLQLAVKAGQWSDFANLPTKVYACSYWYETLIASEQWASYVDRPFHPLAKCKMGFEQSDYQKYMAEFSRPIVLVWYAVAKTHLIYSDVIINVDRQNPVNYLLSDQQRLELNRELSKKKIQVSHIAIPVHPWQEEHVISDIYTEELLNGIVVKLDFNQSETWASSSMRSMLFNQDTPHSVKLPLGVYALNSKRYLPSLKLINGEKNQEILVQARELDPVLKQMLYLWDERHWWGYMFSENRYDKSPSNPGFFQEKPTHLGVMIRSLPDALCHNHIRLLSMASLGMVNGTINGTQHIFDEIIISQNSKINETAVLQNFRQLCDVFFSVILRCICIGFAPEMHGQNVIMILENHQFFGLLLRDHDSVRVHLPWLNEHGIKDPEYLSPLNFRNRLYRETPNQLIFYLQSLGILVNIRAIVESLSVHYQMEEDLLWREVRMSIEQCFDEVDFTYQQRGTLKEQIIDNPIYPHKTLILPVIERADEIHGSMPAGESTTVNPLHACASDINGWSVFD